MGRGGEGGSVIRLVGGNNTYVKKLIKEAETNLYIVLKVKIVLLYRVSQKQMLHVEA